MEPKQPNNHRTSNTDTNHNIQLPPGFRFHPSDEELILHYLKNKALSRPVPASIVADIDLYKYNPWELPMKALFGDEEWYFFSPRDRKYPNGARPNRAAASGYWKATGTDKPILTSSGIQSIGVKKALVFYKGHPPKGTKTSWIMHEYRLLDSMIKPSSTRSRTRSSSGSMRLDDWVLCRVRQKDHNQLQQRSTNWEAQNSSSTTSPTVVLQPAEPSFDIVDNYLSNDCPLLACILASHDQAGRNINGSNTTDHSNNLYFQGGGGEEVSEVGSTSLITADSISINNPLKRKSSTIEGYDDDRAGGYYESLFSSSMMSPSSKKQGSRINTVVSFTEQYYVPQNNIFDSINALMGREHGLQ